MEADRNATVVAAAERAAAELEVAAAEVEVAAAEVAADTQPTVFDDEELWAELMNADTPPRMAPSRQWLNLAGSPRRPSPQQAAVPTPSEGTQGIADYEECQLLDVGLNALSQETDDEKDSCIVE
jgi:hypothetical protein